MKYYRPLSLLLAVAFTIVGIAFAAIPNGVLHLFNSISSPFSLPQMPVAGYGFYLVLATAYMYLVTVIASMMYRLPRNRFFPIMLIHAKLASSAISISLFLFQARYLIYAANFLIDGTIGSVVLVLYITMERNGKWESS